MVVVGITGGVAAGKSAVTRMLKARGAVTFSADEASRAVVAPDGPVLKAIAGAFGADVLSADGTLDRLALGRRVFADADARQVLNSIVHPAILRLLRAQIDAARDDLGQQVVIAVEAPLLFEANLGGWFERIVAVTASEPTQIARLTIRNTLNESEARSRVAAQWPTAEKAARADYVIYNDGSLADLEIAVTRLWEELAQFGLKSIRNR